MRARLYGRTTQGCGSDWDSLRPWDCDDVIKAHFVRERNLELGAVVGLPLVHFSAQPEPLLSL
jgi:hypothetical protein